MKIPAPAGTITLGGKSPEFIALQHPAEIFMEEPKIALLKAHMQLEST